jgi:hypothetical protein
MHLIQIRQQQSFPVTSPLVIAHSLIPAADCLGQSPGYVRFLCNDGNGLKVRADGEQEGSRLWQAAERLSLGAEVDVFDGQVFGISGGPGCYRGRVLVAHAVRPGEAVVELDEVLRGTG